MRSWKNKVLVAGLAMSLNPLLALGQSTPQNPPATTNPQASTQTNPHRRHRRHRRHHRKHRRHHRRPVAMIMGNAAFPA